MKTKRINFISRICTICITSFIMSLFVPVSETMAQVGFSTDTASGCSPLTITFTNASAIGDFYYWNFDDGDDTMSVDAVHTFYSPGEYNVGMMALDSNMNIMGYDEITKIGRASCRERV